MQGSANKPSHLMASKLWELPYRRFWYCLVIVILYESVWLVLNPLVKATHTFFKQHNLIADEALNLHGTAWLHRHHVDADPLLTTAVDA